MKYGCLLFKQVMHCTTGRSIMSTTNPAVK